MLNDVHPDLRFGSKCSSSRCTRTGVEGTDNSALPLMSCGKEGHRRTPPRHNIAGGSTRRTARSCGGHVTSRDRDSSRTKCNAGCAHVHHHHSYSRNHRSKSRSDREFHRKHSRSMIPAAETAVVACVPTALALSTPAASDGRWCQSEARVISESIRSSALFYTAASSRNNRSDQIRSHHRGFDHRRSHSSVRNHNPCHRSRSRTPRKLHCGHYTRTSAAAEAMLPVGVPNTVAASSTQRRQRSPPDEEKDDATRSPAAVSAAAPALVAPAADLHPTLSQDQVAEIVHVVAARVAQLHLKLVQPLVKRPVIPTLQRGLPPPPPCPPFTPPLQAPLRDLPPTPPPAPSRT